MGYSHGRRWTDEDIKLSIRKVVLGLGLDRMPSRKECEQYFGDTGLTNAVSKRKGWYALAREMELPIKNSETYLGKLQERKARELLEARGFVTEQMPQNFPYDILVNECVKVDVKSSHLYNGKNGNFYSFNLEKKFATCDVYILFALSDDNEIIKAFIVPSKCVIKNTQISIGESHSKYHKFLDRWDYIAKIADYMASIGEGL